MESSQLKLQPNPCETANILSKLFFAWTIPFFKKCYNHVLKLTEVYEPLKCDRSESLGDRLEANWVKGQLKANRSSLLSVVLATFWKDFALLSVFYFCNDIIFRLGQPFLLGHLLDYFRKGSNTEKHVAWMYAGGMIILSALNALFNNHIFQIAFHTGMKVRVSVCSLIYRKALRLSQTALGETSPGKMVNLLTNDVNRFDWSTFFVNSLWVSPVLAIIVGFLVWNESGIAGVIGILVVFAMVPILSYGGKLTSQYRLQTALKTDERVRFMDEIISAVQVIKMYAWETSFSNLIAHARKLELKIIRKTSYIRGLSMTSLLVITRAAQFCVMLSIYLIYGAQDLTASRIFAISTYLTITSMLMSLRFARSVGETAEVFVALKRLEKFFELDEKILKPQTDDNGKNGSINHFKQSLKVSISLADATARWPIAKDNTSDSDSNRSANHHSKTNRNELPIQDVLMASKQRPTLDSLNIEFPKRKLIGVIGPVGSGKSSLLQAILRELPVETGSIRINGTISYACQEPWIFSSSVRQNILFGEKFDHERYNAVVRVCALSKDFEQFEKGDLTIVGDRGASLSGGQKARINLARACYREADIYLLDDPLSAVDAHVGTHIFDKCIGPNGYLAKRRSTRILVTHQVHFLKQADWLVVLKNGKVEVQGSPADLYSSGIDFINLVGIDEPLESDENASLRSRHNSESFSRRSFSTNSLSSLENAEAIETIEYYANDNIGGVQLEESSKGKVKGSVAVNYFRAGGSWLKLSILFISFIFVQFLGNAMDYWVSIWTKQEEMRSWPEEDRPSVLLSTETCIYIQASLLAGLLIFGIARSIKFYDLCIRISQNIHNAMFNGIISTSMRFFDTNPAGRILNRFSKDLGTIDELQPKSLLDATQNIISIIGSAIVAAVVNPYFLLPVLILTAIFILMRKVFLKTAKNVNRLEGIAKSPAFTHLSATLNGLPTIRAYNREDILTREFDNLQDLHSACWFMSFTTGSMFGLCLDILCAVFITCIICYYMILETGATGEKIGLAISQAIALTLVVPWGVRQSADVNTQMTAAERVLAYRDLEPEKQPNQPLAVEKYWPSEGCIEFRKVFYRYYAEGEPVLRDLSFVLKPMEKIGVVGRTGAGKSSLIGALFRLACVEGEIVIDGIDTSSIKLSDLRKRIAIIPQDPVLFSGTLRRNLDPFEEYSDDEIWNALECVELKDVVSDAFGLQSAVQPHGSNYSVGQRQLLCLARAILRKNRILVLDEATANVDPQTDALIQQTIRSQFIQCTVLTVAHRLHTIIDSDRVMVMDFGRLVEFDKPYNLLLNHNGIFHGMVTALGEQEFDRLAEIALRNYNETDS